MADRLHSRRHGAARAKSSSRPHTWNSLVAAAEVVTSKSVRRAIDPVRLMAWQEEAWGHYDSGLTGEFRFGINWLSNGLSRVNLTAARPPETVGDEPTLIDQIPEEDRTATERRAIELVEMIGGGPTGQSQMMAEFGRLLPLNGFAWLVAEPALTDPQAEEYVTWSVYAQDALDVRSGAAGSSTYWVQVQASTSSTGGQPFRELHPNSLIVKCWRPHPRRRWEPDAPTRGVLGILEQIELLTQSISASAQSRLAGAGLLVLPSEADFPRPPTADRDEPDPDNPDADDADDWDPLAWFTENLVSMMTVPIKDRGNASAVVPYAIQIPGEFVDKVRHIDFSSAFSERAEELLQQAIKRLALGLDMPPEVLTGMAGVNHWTAWQVEDTAVTLHIEPSAELVCHALTEGFLREALEAEGLESGGALVWYDTADLTAPADLSKNAIEAYDRRELNGKALRRYLGVNETDEMDDDEVRVAILLDVLKSVPSLAPVLLPLLGIVDAAIGAQMAEVGARDVEVVEPVTPAEPDVVDETPPDDEGRPGPEVAALVAAADGVVYRALERSGARLKSAIGRKVNGGPASVEHPDVTTLHTTYDATVYADLDHLLEGAFVRVPEIAEFLEVDAAALTATLRAYCRGLLAAGHPHSRERLTAALGLDGAR